jgi:hypothetical protein
MPRVMGDPAYWSDIFPQELVPEIIGLIFSVWTGMTHLSASEHEVPITRRFRSALIRDKNMRKELPVRISRECVEDDLRTGKELGRIDLCFIPPNRCHEYVYFAFECKRLNVVYRRRLRSLAPAYVKSGMMRFITSQYSSRLSQGGMIGYVMDGKVPRAVNAVNRNVRRQQVALKMSPPAGLNPWATFLSGGLVSETEHLLGTRKFVLRHVFLPL